MFKKILGVILFFILPIFLVTILCDITFLIYKDTILEGLKALGNKEMLTNISPYRIGYVLIIGISFLSYKIMGRKIFLIAILFWIVTIGGILFFINRPIEGLVDIPDSVFTLSGIDLNKGMPRLPTETCNQITMLVESLSGVDSNGNTQTKMHKFLNDESYKEMLLNTYPQYRPILQYIHVPRINPRNYGLQLDIQKIGLQNHKDRILSGKYTLEDIIQELPNEQLSEYRESVLQNQKIREELYKPWKNALDKELNEVITLFYTNEEQENIRKLIDVVNTINNNNFGYCIKDTGNISLANEAFFGVSYELKIARILAQYSVIQASVGNYVDAYKIMNSISQHIYQNQQHTFTLVGSMINIAMKGIYYDTLNELKTFDFPKSLQKRLVNDMRKFNNTPMMLNALRGEYFLASHWMISRDFEPNKLYIPILLDGKETDMINRNIFASMLFMIDSNIPISKYTKNPEDKIIDITVGWNNIHNYIGRTIMSAFALNMDGYIKRSLLNDIEKNTVISSIGE